MLVLSLFPGIDLLGRGFESEGYCVVRGPDLIWGGDVRTFNAPSGKFEGVIGGSPCQDFSTARRTQPTGYGQAMLQEFARIVGESQPNWFLLENVPGVPDMRIEGYSVQRLNLSAQECGGTSNRNRTFQFGSRDDKKLVPARADATAAASPQRAAMSTDGARARRRGWSEFCMAQGLPADFDLPNMSLGAKYKAVGNGVHIAVARTIARAVREAGERKGEIRLCVCQCGRPVGNRRTLATPACRKRMQRRRDRAEPVTPRAVTTDGATP